MRPARLCLALLAAALAAPTTAQPPATAPVPAEEAWAQLTKLVGRWRPADGSDGALTIRFTLIAGGTVLVESWERANGEPHALTLYHRDGLSLIATRYGPGGNQPRLALTGRGAQGLHFTFRDATNLDRANPTSTTSGSTSLIQSTRCARRPSAAARARERRSACGWCGRNGTGCASSPTSTSTLPSAVTTGPCSQKGLSR